MSHIAVTHHALRRYMERIMGVNFRPMDRHKLDDRQAVEVACEAYGIDLKWVEAQIVNDVAPRIPPMFRLRGSHKVFKGERGKYVVNSGCVVVSVYQSEWSRHADSHV